MALESVSLLGECLDNEFKTKFLLQEDFSQTSSLINQNNWIIYSHFIVQYRRSQRNGDLAESHSCAGNRLNVIVKKSDYDIMKLIMMQKVKRSTAGLKPTRIYELFESL